MKEAGNTSQQVNNSAKTRFLGTVELVHKVLSLLLPHDLLAISRTNQYLRSIIRGSSALRATLAHGPVKHFSDLPPDVWTLQNVAFREALFDRAPDLYAFEEPTDNAFRLRVYETPEYEHDRQSLCRRQDAKNTATFIDWYPDDEPQGNSSSKEFGDLDLEYLTDPPLPTLLHCPDIYVVGHRDETITVQDRWDQTLFFNIAFVDVELGTCTFGQVCRVARALKRSPPKRWDYVAETDQVAGSWRPQTDYPELMADSDFRSAIDSIPSWPVMWTAYALPNRTIRSRLVGKQCRTDTDELLYPYSSLLSPGEIALKGPVYTSQVTAKLDPRHYTATIGHHQIHFEVEAPLEIDNVEIGQRIKFMLDSTDGNERKGVSGTGRTTALVFKPFDIHGKKFQRLGTTFDFPAALSRQPPEDTVAIIVP